MLVQVIRLGDIILGSGAAAGKSRVKIVYILLVEEWDWLFAGQQATRVAQPCMYNVDHDSRDPFSIIPACLASGRRIF